MFTSDARGLMGLVTYVVMACVCLVLLDHTGAWTGLSDYTNTFSWIAACGTALLVVGALAGGSPACVGGMVMPALITAFVLSGGDQAKIVVFSVAAAVVGGAWLAADMPMPFASFVPTSMRLHSARR